MGAELADLYVTLRSVTAPLKRGFAEATVEGESLAAKTGSWKTALTKLGAGAALVGVVVAGVSVKMAADWQSAMVRLGTSAGETGALVNSRLTGNLKLVSDGLLKMAIDTATSTGELAKGMYMVESAGFHGAAGLKVMQAAAEGAKAEGAPLQDMANALTSALKSYHLGADQSVAVTNQFVAAVGHGKMTMSDFAASISTVLPIASAAHLSLAQVGGAMATLTNHGTSAHEATQELASSIRNLLNPNLQAQREMARLGLTANDVSTNLGKRGLTGTLDVLTQAIASHTKGGQVLIDTFNRSKQAGQDMQIMLRSMPAQVRDLAQAYANGQLSAGAYSKALQGLSGDQATMGRQFAVTYNRAQGFNDFLKQGSAPAQTYTAALSKMMGGSIGLNTALMLTGENTASFNENVKAVGDAAKGAGKHVAGWDEITKTFNFQLGQLRELVVTTGIKIGTVLIPPVSAAIRFFTQHTAVTKGLAAVIGGILLVAIGAYTVSMASAAVATIAATWPILLIIAAVAALVVAGIWLYQNWGTIWAGIKTVAASVWGWMTGAWSATWSAITGVFHSATGAIHGAWNKVTGAFGASVAFFQKLPGRILSGVGALPGLLLSWATSLLGHLAYAFGYGLGLIVKEWVALPGQIMNGVSALWGLATGLFTRLWHWLVQVGVNITLACIVWARNTYQGVTTWFQQLPGRVTTFLRNLWNDAVLFGARIVIDSIVWARNTINGVTSWFQQLPGRVMSFIGSLPGKIKGAFSDAGSWLWNAGQEIVQGLLGGLKSMAGNALSAVKNLGGDMLSGFKSAMGISSPSRVFAEAGKWIPAGIAAGITSNMGTVHAALAGAPTSLGTGMTAGGAGTLTPAGPSGGGGRSSGPGGGVQISVYVDGQPLYSGVRVQAQRRDFRNRNTGLTRSPGAMFA